MAVFGFSYLAYCAWQAAAYESPYLKTIIPMFGSQDAYQIWTNKGVPYLKDRLFWHSKYLTRYDRDVAHATIDQALEEYPIDTADARAIGETIPVYQEYLQHPAPDNYWKAIGIDLHSCEKRLPVLCISGWYDRYVQDTIDDWKKCGDLNSQLIIGPWHHKPTKTFSEMNWGSKSKFTAVFKQILGWCNRWLKDGTAPEVPLPLEERVRYFVMGSNVWRNASSWPPEEAVCKTLYLDQEGILFAGRSQDEASRSYVYDPCTPAPSLGSHILYGNGMEGPKEQNGITAREDVLLFRTNPVGEDVVVAGQAKVVLYLSSSAVDTDFVVRLSDVHPNGAAYALQSEIIRMRYRKGVDFPELITPGTIYEVEITLPSTCHSFRKGHQVQLQVTSSDFPNHSVNLNTAVLPEEGTESQPATQTLYTGGQYASRLLLPILQ